MRRDERRYIQLPTDATEVCVRLCILALLLFWLNSQLIKFPSSLNIWAQQKINGLSGVQRLQWCSTKNVKYTESTLQALEQTVQMGEPIPNSVSVPQQTHSSDLKSLWRTAWCLAGQHSCSITRPAPCVLMWPGLNLCICMYLFSTTHKQCKEGTKAKGLTPNIVYHT